MRRFCLAFFSAILLIFHYSDLSAQSTLSLESDGYGAGIIHEVDGRCYVITPTHTIGEVYRNTQSDDIDMNLSVGNLLNTLDDDIAILKIDQTRPIQCKKWQVSDKFEQAFEESFMGYLRISNTADANDQRVPVLFVDKNEKWINIATKQVDQSLTKFDCGTILYAEYEEELVPLGMLFDVDEEGETASVYRLDRLYKEVNEYIWDARSMKPKKDYAGWEVEPTDRPLVEQVSVVDDFRFEVHSLERQGDESLLLVWVTNLDYDPRPILLDRRYNKFADDLGHVYQQNQVCISNVCCTSNVQDYYLYLKNVERSCVNNLLPPGTPVKMNIIIPDIPAKAASLSFAELYFSVNGATNRVKLKNIQYSE